jgi:RimJ/RimL family protein N-acetyltransferase
MSAVPVLTTPRLTLRPRRDADAEALYPVLSDPAVMRWWSRAPLESLEATRAYLARDATGDWRAWFITLTGDDRAIGWVSTGEKRQGGVSEIGYILSPAVQGQGIAREALSAVIDRLFAEGKRRVFADTDPENAASNRLLETLGFRREGLLRAEWETHIGVRDSVIWGLLREEWQCSISR